MFFQRASIIYAFLAYLLIGQHSFAQSALDMTSDPKAAGQNLTDEEQMIVETYVHEGKINRELQEACNENSQMLAACQGRDVNPKTLGISGGMVKALTKAYTMVVGTMALSSGGGLVMDKPDKATGDTPKEDLDELKESEKGAENAKKKEKKQGTDYCQYIAIGTEAVALFQQTQTQQNLDFENSNQNTQFLQASTNATANGKTAVAVEPQQKKVLNKAARSHKERAKNAKFQAAGWGVTTACYAAMMSRPSVDQKSFTNWLKLGSSGLLTYFFSDQAKQYDEYYKKIKGLADQIPGAGDCNPITDRDCYCSQPETENDPKYCLPQLHARAIAQNSFRVACTDNKAQPDPKCNCTATDTCLDNEVTRQLKATATDLNSALSASFLQPLQALARGELKSGSVSGSALGLANKARREIDKASVRLSQLDRSGSPLSSEQKREFDAIKKLGASDALARALAKTPLSPTGKKNLAKFSGGGSLSHLNSSNKSAKRKSGTSVLTFENMGKSKRKKKKNKFDNPFTKFGRKKKTRRKNGNQVLTFAKRAEQRAAQIDRRKETPIFDIISHRYRKTALGRLGVK